MSNFRGEAVASWTMPSSTDPSKKYTVKKWQDGSWSCDCKGWTMKRAGQERNCTHIVAIQTVAGSVQVETPVTPLTGTNGARRFRI